jgi:hypothetical protein
MQGDQLLLLLQVRDSETAGAVQKKPAPADWFVDTSDIVFLTCIPRTKDFLTF